METITKEYMLKKAEHANWPELEELETALNPVPSWDPSLLSESLGAYVADRALYLRTAPEMIAGPLIVALGSAIGRRCLIRPNPSDTWATPPNLYGAIVGSPSTMKSPALEAALKPLQSLQREKYLEHSTKHQEWEAEIAKTKDKKAMEGKGPKAVRYIVGDTTIEALQGILTHNPMGALMHWDELTGWLMGMLKQGREQDRAFYLSAWNGTTDTTIDRVGRGHIFIANACLSIVGGIQEGPLRALLAQAVSNGTGADGLLQRFQVLLYPEPLKHWAKETPAADVAAYIRVRDVFSKLLNMSPQAVGANLTGEAPTLPFSQAAQSRYDDWAYWWNNRFRKEKELPAVESHLLKYKSLVPSLALIFHLVEWAAGQAPSGPVSLAALERAIQWSTFLEGHMRRLYGIDPASQSQDAVHLLLDKIQLGKLASGFSTRDAYRKGWAGLGRRAVESAVSTLCNHGYLMKLEMGNQNFYTVNPAVVVASVDNPPPLAKPVEAPPKLQLVESVPF